MNASTATSSICQITDDKGQAYPSIVTLIDNAVNKYSNKTAFRYEQHSLSYTEYASLSRSFAAYLQSELGIRQGHRVAVMLPNCLAFPVALFSILRIGAVQVTLNPLFTYKELKQRLVDADAHTLLINENIASQFSPLLNQLPIQYLITSSASDCTGENRTYPNRTLPYTDWQEALSQGGGLKLSTIELQANAIAFIQYSDVSGGSELGVALSHGNLISNVSQLNEELKQAVGSGMEVVLTCSPLHHRQTLTVNLLYYLSVGSENVFLASPFDINSIYNTINDLRVTVLSGNDILYNQLLSNPSYIETKLCSLRLCLSGSFSSLPSISDKWFTATKLTIKYSYGHAETGLIFCCTPDTVAYAFIKHLRTLANTDLQLRDKQGLPVTTGETGELCCKGPQVMSGYWRQPEKTRLSFTSDGYYRTGELGFIDKQGHLTLVGRHDDLIQVQGDYVYLTEIESIIMLLPQVRRCSCCCTMQPNRSTYIVAHIETKNQQSISTQDVYSHCKRYLNQRKHPLSIYFVDQLPRPTRSSDFTREALNQHPYFDYTNGVNHDS